MTVAEFLGMVVVYGKLSTIFLYQWGVAPKTGRTP